MNPLLKRSDMARDSKGITQFYLPPTHEPYLPLLPSRRASPPFGWYSLRPPTEGWPGWLIGDRLYTEIDFPAPAVEPRIRSSIPVLTNVITNKTYTGSFCNWSHLIEPFSVRARTADFYAGIYHETRVVCWVTANERHDYYDICM